MCCNIPTGTVVWIYPFSFHASELAESCLQESVGVRELCVVPCCSQLAVIWLLTAEQEETNSEAALGTHMGFGDIMVIQSQRRHKQHKIFGSEARH